MPTISIDIPDRLVVLYQTARASYNARAGELGLPLLPAPSKAMLETWAVQWMKSRIIGEAVRTDLDMVTLEALIRELRTL